MTGLRLSPNPDLNGLVRALSNLRDHIRAMTLESVIDTAERRVEDFRNTPLPDDASNETVRATHDNANAMLARQLDTLLRTLNVDMQALAQAASQVNRFIGNSPEKKK